MNDHTPGHGCAAGTDLDPEIRRFVMSVNESWARYPLDKLSHAEVRRIAEQVRAPWSRGGPVMHRSSEHRVPFGGARIRIRVHRPSDEPLSRALIYLHGGGWTYFSIDTHDRLMREYAHRAQAAVVGVEYSLSPEAKFPRALHETVAVVQWLRDRGETLGIDPHALAIGGDSAGANLSIATALALREEGAGNVLRGMLLHYGAFDSSCDFPSYGAFDGPAYLLASRWRSSGATTLPRSPTRRGGCGRCYSDTSCSGARLAPPLRPAVMDVTLHPVRSLVFHRWAVIFLMLGRLVFGEFAHAMPHSSAPASDAGAFVTESAPACPDHAGASPAPQPSSEQSHGVHSEDEDCCKAKGCKCPCVHLPPAASDPLVIAVAKRDSHRVSEPVLGAAPRRLSALFRPPA